MDLSLKVDQGNLTFDHVTCCFQLHFLRQRRYVRQIRIFPVFRVNKVNSISLSQQNRCKIITIIFSKEIKRFYTPNLVLKTIRMIKKGLWSGNLRLHGAFRWRHFRFVIIEQFLPILSRFRQSAHFFFHFVDLNRFKD